MFRPIGLREGSWRTAGARLACVALLSAAGLVAQLPEISSASYVHSTVSGEYGKEGSVFTGLGTGCHLAYQGATHRLYLLADSRIYGLDRTGLGAVSPLGGAFPVEIGANGSCGDPHIAVDNTSGASGGSLYVVPSSTGIYGFTPAGAPLGGSWPVDAGGEVCGVAVTGTGEVWAADYTNSKVTRLSATGTPLGSIALAQKTCKIAVDRVTGDLYAVGFSDALVTKLTAATGYKPALTFPPAADWGNAGIAVDGASHRLYVPAGRRIRAYDTNTGSLVETIESEGQAKSVAVDESTGTIFVADAARGTIKEMPLQPAPEVSTGPASNAGLAARLTGQIDPVDVSMASGCHFEYVEYPDQVEPSYEFAKSAPCVPAPPYYDGTSVSASVVGLAEHTTIHYRLVAESPQGTGIGSDRTFTTPLRPYVNTDIATELGQDKATVTGWVGLNGAPAIAACRFEYTDEASYAAGGFSGAEEAPCSPSPPYLAPGWVRAMLTGLRAATTYRYRLSAENVEGGATVGGVQSFKTLLPDPPDEEEPEGRERNPRQRKVACAKKACTRVLGASARPRNWSSPKFPAEYGWLFGVYKDGQPLPDTGLSRGCIGTFRGRGVVATLNACRGRFRLTYSGNGEFKIRWRVFEFCRCGEKRRKG